MLNNRNFASIYMKNSNKLKLAFGIVTVYTFLAHQTLKNLRDQSREHVDNNFGNTTLLVVAHPDDETMFFGPTIFNLLGSNRSIRILCLSNGNADNIGLQREVEFARVMRSFGTGIDLTIISDRKLQDSDTLYWDPGVVAKYMADHIYNSSIQTLVTFDSYGVSGHTNHRSIYYALQTLRLSLKQPKIDLLVLKSVNIFRKYMFFLDSVFTMASSYLTMAQSARAFSLALDLTSHSSLKQILKLHASQMVWYRQLYMVFSRYMFINDLEYLT